MDNALILIIGFIAVIAVLLVGEVIAKHFDWN